jgi:hypothetical protein
MPTKPKTTQPEKPEEVQTRDFFQTPRYATKLLLPFIPKNIKNIWEPAAGYGAISNYLNELNFNVLSTEINGKYEYFNFLNATQSIVDNGMIVTNPPFSLKKKFYLKCKELNIPFALLIPADYSGWIINALRFDNAEKIIPTSRINYITPSGKQGKESASQFHSLWLTWGLGLGKSETFVDLTKNDKEFI